MFDLFSCFKKHFFVSPFFFFSLCPFQLVMRYLLACSKTFPPPQKKNISYFKETENPKRILKEKFLSLLFFFFKYFNVFFFLFLFEKKGRKRKKKKNSARVPCCCFVSYKTDTDGPKLQGYLSTPPKGFYTLPLFSFFLFFPSSSFILSYFS